MSSCCCSLAGTSACRYCKNNPYAEPATAVCIVQTDTTIQDYPLFKERAKKPKTNADKLRGMTDEELAEFLKGIVQSMTLPVAFANGELIEDWLDWLKQEVIDNTEN